MQGSTVKTLPAGNILNPRIREHLAGRAACWHHHLGGEISLDRCQDAVLTCVGYPTTEALIDDYSGRKFVDGKDFSTALLDDRWKRWLTEPDIHVANAQRDRALAALIAFAYFHRLNDFRIRHEPSLEPMHRAHIQWTAGGNRAILGISEAVAGAIFSGAGSPLQKRGATSEEARAWPTPTGFVLVRDSFWKTDHTVTFQVKETAPSQAGDIPSERGVVQSFLDALMAEYRAERTPDAPTTRTVTRRLRS